jgi:hypothetical protein
VFDGRKTAKFRTTYQKKVLKRQQHEMAFHSLKDLRKEFLGWFSFFSSTLIEPLFDQQEKFQNFLYIIPDRVQW